MKKGNFSKIVTGASIGFVVLYTVVAMSLQFTCQLEPSPTLTTSVFALFGTELAVNGFIKMNKTKYGTQDDDFQNPEGDM